jgi:hypothetical protein
MPTSDVTPENIITPEDTETLPAPSETEIPNIIEITAENTEVATEAITTDVVTVLYFRDFFSDADLPEWTFGAGWAFVPTIPNDQALQVFNNSSPATYILQDFFNVDAEIRTFVQHGAVQLTVRESNNGRYTATLEPSGQISLSRAGMVVMSQTIPNFNAFVWHQVRLSAQNQTVRVFVDNLQVLVFNDPNLLPMGKVSFNGLFYPMGDATPSLPQNTIQVDEFSIFVPSSEMGVLQTPVPLATSEAMPNATPTFTSAMNFMPTMPEEPMMMAFSSSTPFCENIEKTITVIAGDVSALRAALYTAQTCSEYEFTIYVQLNSDPNISNAFYLDTLDRPGLSIQGSVILFANGATFSPVPQVENTYPLFYVDSNASIRIHHAIFNEGYNSSGEGRSGYGGAISNYGYMTIFDSQFINNRGTEGGGAIINSKNMSIERTTFVGNSAGGGGAIQNENGGYLVIACSVFKDNRGDYGAAILNGMTFNNAGRVTVTYSKFEGNATNLGNPSNIVNLQSGNEYEYEVIADNNYWIGEMAVDADIRVDNPLEADPTTPNRLTGQYDYPECISRGVRAVADEAKAFHLYADRFGLPLPFDVWPITTEDYNNNTTWKQGYGASSFSKRAVPPPYEGTHQVHTGIDFTAISSGLSIQSVCDGVVIGGRTTGPYTGYGLTVHCFAQEDTDGDGIRNLSNIVVSYNHLSPERVYGINSKAIVYKGEYLGETKSYYVSQTARFCKEKDPNGSGTCEINNLQIININNVDYIAGTDCIFSDPNTKYECGAQQDFRFCAGMISNQCIIPEYGEGVECLGDLCSPRLLISNHLHFEVFIAKGYKHGYNAIRINPLLMFTPNLVQSFIKTQGENDFDFYFPYNSDDNKNFPDVKGINDNQITSFTLSGELGDRHPRKQGFYQIQIPEPIGIVEWWNTNPTDVPPRMQINIVDFLVGDYSAPVFVGASCEDIPLYVPIIELPSRICVFVGDPLYSYDILEDN